MKDNTDYQATKALINITKKKHTTGVSKEHISAIDQGNSAIFQGLSPGALCLSQRKGKRVGAQMKRVAPLYRHGSTPPGWH
jgi:hypothetical protein